MDSSAYDFIFDHLKTFFFPEEWLDLDLNFSKTELISLLLVERYGEMSMSQICEAMNMPMSTATGIIDRMVKKGVIGRQRSDSDRRVVVVCITKKGEEVTNHWKKIFFEYITQIEEALTEEERQVIFKVFLKVMDIINRKVKTTATPESITNIHKIEIE